MKNFTYHSVAYNTSKAIQTTKKYARNIICIWNNKQSSTFWPWSALREYDIGFETQSVSIAPEPTRLTLGDMGRHTSRWRPGRFVCSNIRALSSRSWTLHLSYNWPYISQLSAIMMHNIRTDFNDLRFLFRKVSS